MWDHIRRIRFMAKRGTTRTSSRRERRSTARPAFVESLEDRQLLTASLQSISNLVVPSLQGITLPLLSNPVNTDAQTFTVTSSNPDVGASVAVGPFWTVGVSYTDPINHTNSFTGSLTFQLFQDLTPNTVNMIKEFTNDNYYTNTGKLFSRVASNFDDSGGFLIQGGAANETGVGSSGQPGTPFANENVQQLASTGSYQLSMSNSGGTDSNDTQFFINSAPLNSDVGYGYTVFGQLVSGMTTLAQMAQIPVEPNVFGEDSEPVYPLTITSTTLTPTNPNGVVVIDTTQAHPDETSSITVTATDSVDHTTAQQSFVVTVGPYTGPTSSALIQTVNFKPFANPTPVATIEDTAQQVQLAGQDTIPIIGETVPLTYSILSQPGHGTISSFNPSTGTFIYTPTPGFTGTDTFTYNVTTTGPNTSAPPATSNPGTVTVTVGAPPLVTLQAVQISVNKRHLVTQILVTFSGPVDSTEADLTTTYRLSTQGKHRLFNFKGSQIFRLRKAFYTASSDQVALTPKTPFTLARPVQLIIFGTPPSGLQDSFGRYIDGADNGRAGSNATALLERRGVFVGPAAPQARTASGP